ncbi:hypothetical protein [Herbidospora cretacea]|uniref:hypothetical protein n=1 Tax=Herbidospora cretacea TaxID=28444 RepID=UPI001E5184A1|nr:hypothetical protein [Herbidospora cretacea]
MPKTVFAAVTAALLLTLTACGGAEEAAAAPAPSGGPGDRTALAECLKEHGVTLPEGGFRDQGGQMGNRPRGGGQRGERPSGEPAGGDRSGGGQWGERPSGEPGPRPSGFPSMDDKTREAFQACGGGNRRQMDDSALNAFRTCMKDNGAEVRSLRDVNREDAAIKKALEKCRPLMPSTS